MEKQWKNDRKMVGKWRKNYGNTSEKTVKKNNGKGGKTTENGRKMEKRKLEDVEVVPAKICQMLNADGSRGNWPDLRFQPGVTALER